MNRFLLLALTAGLLSPITAKAEPIPKISDWDAELNWPVRIDFRCPVKVTYEMENGRREKITTKLYPKCWADFHESHINIMDRQVIKREDVLGTFEPFQLRLANMYGLVYKKKNNELAVFKMSKDMPFNLGVSHEQMRWISRTTKVINAWMGL